MVILLNFLLENDKNLAEKCSSSCLKSGNPHSPFLKNDKNQAEKFLNKFEIRQVPPFPEKNLKHEQKKSLSTSFDSDMTPPPYLKKIQSEADFFLGWLSLPQLQWSITKRGRPH